MKLGSIVSGLANTIPVSAIINFATTIQSFTLNSFAPPTGVVNMNGQKLTSLGAPSAAGDATSKSYVDGAISSGDAATLASAQTYADNKVAGFAKVARGTFVGNGTLTTFDAVHNLGNSNVDVTVKDAAGNLVLVDCPPKAGALTTTSVITFNGAPLAADGTYSWLAVG